jgi:hypothetical protein
VEASLSGFQTRTRQNVVVTVGASLGLQLSGVNKKYRLTTIGITGSGSPDW